MLARITTSVTGLFCAHAHSARLQAQLRTRSDPACRCHTRGFLLCAVPESRAGDQRSAVLRACCCC
eukprot:262793-Rhodomonas_salina.1